MSECPKCGADTRFSPCCGRAAAAARVESEFERAVRDLVDAKAWYALENILATRRQRTAPSPPPALWASFRCDTCDRLILEERITPPVVGNWRGVSNYWLTHVLTHAARCHPESGQTGTSISDPDLPTSTGDPHEK